MDLFGTHEERLSNQYADLAEDLHEYVLVTHQEDLVEVRAQCWCWFPFPYRAVGRVAA